MMRLARIMAAVLGLTCVGTGGFIAWHQYAIARDSGRVGEDCRPVFFCLPQRSAEPAGHRLAQERVGVIQPLPDGMPPSQVIQATFAKVALDLLAAWQRVARTSCRVYHGRAAS